MAGRLVMAVALLLMLLAQAWGGVAVWRDNPLRGLTVLEKKEAKHPPTTQATVRRTSLQPALPAVLPDFNQGYIFNAERSLSGGGGSRGPQSRNAVNVGWDKVQYNGSIITGADTRKALLSYPQGGQPPSGGGGAPGVAAPAVGFLRVVVGDTVNGYKVTEILPEKITFSREGQKMTKQLHDKFKERVQGQGDGGRSEQSGQRSASAITTSTPSPKAQEQPVPPSPSRKLPESLPGMGEFRPPTPRRRPLPPPEGSVPQSQDAAPAGKNLFQVLIEQQRQRDQSRTKDEKKITP